jgi:hypothetical protein
MSGGKRGCCFCDFWAIRTAGARTITRIMSVFFIRFELIIGLENPKKSGRGRFHFQQVFYTMQSAEFTQNTVNKKAFFFLIF